MAEEKGCLCSLAFSVAKPPEMSRRWSTGALWRLLCCRFAKKKKKEQENRRTGEQENKGRERESEWELALCVFQRVEINYELSLLF